MLTFLIAQGGRAVEPAAQMEWPLGWGIVAGLIFLGVLAVAVPRPRRHDTEENEKRNRRRELAARK